MRSHRMLLRVLLQEVSEGLLLKPVELLSQEGGESFLRTEAAPPTVGRCREQPYPGHRLRDLLWSERIITQADAKQTCFVCQGSVYGQEKVPQSSGCSQAKRHMARIHLAKPSKRSFEARRGVGAASLRYNAPKQFLIH